MKIINWVDHNFINFVNILWSPQSQLWFTTKLSWTWNRIKSILPRPPSNRMFMSIDLHKDTKKQKFHFPPFLLTLAAMANPQCMLRINKQNFPFSSNKQQENRWKSFPSWIIFSLFFMALIKRARWEKFRWKFPRKWEWINLHFGTWCAVDANDFSKFRAARRLPQNGRISARREAFSGFFGSEIINLYF